MINKGLLTRSTLKPFGSHKDPVPDELPGRIDADILSTETQSNGPPKSVSLEKDPQFPHDGEADQAAQDTVVKKDFASKASRQPKSTDTSTPRMTLLLRVEPATIKAIESYLEGKTDAEVKETKRALVRAFRTFLMSTKVKKAPANKAATSNYRVDLTIPKALREAIFLVESAAPFEQPATVVARNIAPRFSKFISKSIIGQGDN